MVTDPRGYPRFRSHFLPRTRAGWITVVVMLGLFALAEPPLVYVLANRVTPWQGGMPFLYAYLLAIYALMIAVLIIARRRGL